MEDDLMEKTFSFNGEGLTDLIRQTWAEGRLSVALSLCEDSGAPASSHIDICTGKKKIAGVGDLYLEPDNTTTHCGFDIALEASVARLEEKYVKLHTQFANADLRMRYFTLRCDWAGIKYRNPKLEMYPEFTYEKDRVMLNRVGRELAELEPLFSVLYPLVGKTMADVPYHRFTEEEIFEPDLDHPYYLPNLKKNKNEIYEQENPKGKKTVRGGIPAFPKKAIEKESYEDFTKSGELPEITNYPDVVEPMLPEGLENAYVDNAWISRDGDFYGDLRMSIGNVFVHRELADRLTESGIIPVSETMDPQKYLEYVGWIKLSRNEVLFYPHSDDIDYSSAQIKTLKRYAEVRGLDSITIGMFGKKVKVKDLDDLSHFSH